VSQIKTASSCPTCGTSLQTCMHCRGYRNHEVSRLLREQEKPTPVAPTQPKRSCHSCGGKPGGCIHCGITMS
jgi:hypothetical protein